jgi:Flp pilus assembly pilin Flp
MKSVKKSKRLFRNESGQGMVEYILLLVIVVALVSIFKDNIKQTVTDKITNLKDMIGDVQ